MVYSLDGGTKISGTPEAMKYVPAMSSHLIELGLSVPPKYYTLEAMVCDTNNRVIQVRLNSLSPMRAFIRSIILSKATSSSQKGGSQA